MSDSIKNEQKPMEEIDTEVIRKHDEELKHKAEAEKEAFKYKTEEAKKKGQGEGPVTGTDPKS